MRPYIVKVYWLTGTASTSEQPTWKKACQTATILMNQLSSIDRIEVIDNGTIMMSIFNKDLANG